MDHVNVDLEKRDLSQYHASRNKGSFLSKFNPLKSGEDSTDVDTSNSLENTSRGNTQGLMNMFKKAPIDKPKPTTIPGKFAALLPAESNKPRALIFFGLGGLFLLMALANLITIIISPASFTCFFTLAVIFGMISLALWSGPQAYVEKCFEKQY